MRNQLDVSVLESWLWEAACVIRGPVDAPKFKDYILPLVFLKRLSDVFDDEINHLAHEFGDRQIAATLVEQDHQLVRFYIPESARWSKVATIMSGLGQALTDAVRAVARENPRLSGVIDVTDFNATTAGQRILDDGRLAALVQALNHPGQPRNRGLLLRRLPEPDCEESIDGGYNNRRQRRQRGHGSVVLIQPGPPCCGGAAGRRPSRVPRQ